MILSCVGHTDMQKAFGDCSLKLQVRRDEAGAVVVAQEGAVSELGCRCAEARQAKEQQKHEGPWPCSLWPCSLPV